MIVFMGMINELIQKSKQGYVPFSKVTSDFHPEGIIYDDSHIDERESSNDSMCYEIILDCVVDECHHDIVSTYDDYCEDNRISVRACHDITNDSFYVEIIVRESGEGVYIFIENGEFFVSRM